MMQTYDVGYVRIVRVRWVAQADCVAESVTWTSLCQLKIGVTAVEVPGLTIVVGHRGIHVWRRHCTRIDFGGRE
jgi:hypothetical protein